MLDISKVVEAKKCGDLYTNNPDKAKEEHKQLAKMYHPDGNKHQLARQAFENITNLYGRAEKLFELGRWESSNSIDFDTKDGKRKNLKFIKECPFELGTQYISSTIVTYVLDAQNKKYFDNAIKRVGAIRYDNDAMNKAFSLYFPEFMETFETADGKWVLVIKKTKDVLRLKDVLDYFKGNINDKHVAWMMSRLNNLCCFIEHNSMSHNGISLDNCFISPEYHSVVILGGWWYCVEQDGKMIGVQKQVYDIMTPIAKTNKIGSITTDLESVKLIGRTLLGATKAPDSFRSWLDSGSSGDAKNEYTKWSQALDKSYGERKFIKLDLTEKDVYNN